MKPNNKIVVGTHHKTGTMWFAKIFRAICKNLNMEFYMGDFADLPENYDVFFQDHSRIDLSLFKERFRGIHIIRDPRDVIISGCFYHQNSTEDWLHKPKPQFDGYSYQQKINSFQTIDQKILFEMENSAKGTIEEMNTWDYNCEHILELKYEDLVIDTSLALFTRVFVHLGFHDNHIDDLLKITFTNSLFSGKIKKLTHIRSGKPNQWKTYFNENHKRRFLSLFGNILIDLCYEESNNW